MLEGVFSWHGILARGVSFFVSQRPQEGGHWAYWEFRDFEARVQLLARSMPYPLSWGLGSSAEGGMLYFKWWESKDRVVGAARCV